MSRIETFTRDGKTFIYIDFSNLQTNDMLNQVIENAKSTISQYPQKSVYTISNFEGLHFNKDSKDAIIPYVEANKPYVIAGAIIGLDGLKKIMANAILSGRKDLVIVATKEDAIQALLKNQ